MRNTRNIRNIRNILFVLLAAAAVMACRVYGQVRPPTYAIAAKSGTVANIPVHCIPGYIYFATDATAGSNWYLCTATDTWTQQTGSGVGNIAANSVLGNPTGSPAAAIAITQSTACTTGFTGVSPAICATVALTGQSGSIGRYGIKMRWGDLPERSLLTICLCGCYWWN